MSGAVASQPKANIEATRQTDDVLLIRLSGAWLLQQSRPVFSDIEPSLRDPAITRMAFDSQSITAWDTGLLTFLSRLIQYAQSRHIEIDKSGLPGGVQRLLALAAAVPAIKKTGGEKKTAGVLTQIGEYTIDLLRGVPASLAFLGEVILSMGRWLRGKAHYRKSDLFLIIQEVGPHGLGIVALISFLVGLIVAYMGAVQLGQFGGEIYIANLVAIGMVREMGALMTGIIIAGRTGAAFAAQLGTMQVNEEIDALKTLGISVIDFLVLPRLLALIAMMPLLTLYSGLIGVLAGLVVATLVFNIGAFEYYHQTLRALNLSHFAVGIFKGTTYGALVAFSGCLRGMQCGRSAQAVGEATTSAVVTSILLIVIAASLITIVFYKLGI
jgi:phospholipid/cholesterol/gamma-HCH transport system permease protein